MNNVVDGIIFTQMVANGANNLALDCERINALNVFPVPDGDTGTNMKMTIDGGVNATKGLTEKDLGSLSKLMARSMVMSARGNSGVILSQFFRGMAMSLEGKKEVNAKGLAEAFASGTSRSYSVVSNPTEGTILTVMREASEKAIKLINDDSTLEDLFEIYLSEASESLKRTPDLLPCLKEANVVDSGGAGFLLIVEGMAKVCCGDVIVNYENNNESKSTNGFNADSELTFGYCTEFVLQLQNSKVDVKNFDVNILIDFLKSLGNSIVAFKDDDLVKVHVHTFDPGLVLLEGRKYGEFLTIKIENMNVQHSELDNIPLEDAPLKAAPTKEVPHKKYALVAVANGSGLVNTFKELGVDEVVTGGQTMNTSTQDFIDAFDRLNADYILVYPNNGNIKMAAQSAADIYTKSKVVVIPTKTIAQGYSAISMLDLNASIEDIIQIENEEIANVSTLEVTYSIRSCVINGVDVKKGDFICLYNDNLISASKERLDAVKKALDSIKDFKEKQVMTVLCGQDVKIDEFDELSRYAKTINHFIEAYPIQGDQDIYSFIIGIE